MPLKDVCLKVGMLLALVPFLAALSHAQTDPFGPFPTWNLPHPSKACTRDEPPKTCLGQDRFFLVNKTDGSGTTVLGELIERERRSNSVIRDMKKLGLPYNKGLSKYDREQAANGYFKGVYDRETGDILEPGMYEWVLPISDTVGLAKIKKDYKNTYLVGLNGKADPVLSEAFARNSVYYVGGYSGLPAHVFVHTSNNSDGRTGTFQQFAPDGTVRAKFNNILTDETGYYFFADTEANEIVARAINPETGEEASLRWAADGSVIGYGLPVVVRWIVSDWKNSTGPVQLMTKVGRLPMQTNLADDTLYYPVSANGDKIPAPSNFIGMARLDVTDRPSPNNANRRYKNWLLVYALPTGFGYKIADRADARLYPQYQASAAHNVLADEARFKMLSGFGMQRVTTFAPAPYSPVAEIFIAQVFEQYESDGLTPVANAEPGPWHNFSPKADTGHRVDAQSGLYSTNWASSEAAFSDILNQRIENGKAARRSDERYRQALIEIKSRADAERAARIAEMQAQAAERELMRLAYERSPQYHRDQAREKFNSSLDSFLANQRAASAQVSEPNKRLTYDCYDNGDGTQTCFDKWTPY